MLLVAPLSSETRIFHLPDCPYAKRITDDNKIFFIDKDEARAFGYRHCSCCSKLIQYYNQDKKKIDDLLSKISQNVKTVEDMDEKGDDDKKEIASESVRMDKRRIDAIRNNRPLTIFECMTRKYSANVIKDEKAKVAYLNESGSIDTGLIVESAKVMYAFLETLNTLQLEKVDSKYIKNVLDNM